MSRYLLRNEQIDLRADGQNPHVLLRTAGDRAQKFCARRRQACSYHSTWWSVAMALPARLYKGRFCAEASEDIFITHQYFGHNLTI